jgi:hypothetical protein
MKQANLIRTNSGLTDFNLTVYQYFTTFYFVLLYLPKGGLILFTGKLLTNFEACVS